jgi:hypothetical protein
MAKLTISELTNLVGKTVEAVEFNLEAWDLTDYITVTFSDGTKLKIQRPEGYETLVVFVNEKRIL